MQTEWQTVQTQIRLLPLGAVWSGVCTVCPDLPVRKLRIIMVMCFLGWDCAHKLLVHVCIFMCLLLLFATFTNALVVVFPGKESTLVMQHRTQTKRRKQCFFSEPDQKRCYDSPVSGEFSVYLVYPDLIRKIMLTVRRTDWLSEARII